MVTVNRPRRPYESPVRQARAREGRDRMLRSARSLFAARGYAATSIEDIAREAGVGRRSVYDAFGTKRGLLFALLGEIAPGEEARFEEQLAAAAGDAPRQLALAVGFVSTLYERGADVLGIVHAAAGADPDLAALDAEGERRRLENQRSTVEDWHRRGLLRPDLSLARARDVLWAMTSPALFRMLVVDREWAVEAYRTWLVDQLSRELLA
jgi:AcrR family transcriptional regulator